MLEKKRGECRTRNLQQRIVFATNADLEDLVESNQFRSDLYYRMGSLIVTMPLLRDHREDIPELAATILASLARECARDCPKLKCATLDRLIAYDWPGNVRQLEWALKNYMALGKLPDVIRRPGRDPREWQDELGEVLERHDGEVSGAARELRVSRKALYKGLKRKA